MKKIILTILITLLATPSFATEAKKCGLNCLYEINDGILKIYPEDKTKPAKIREKAFEKRTDFKEVYIDEGITEIGDSAFYYDNDDDLGYNLTTVKLPETLTSIGEYAFYQRGGLGSIKIPNNVTEIKKKAFSSSVKIESKKCGLNCHYEINDGILKIYPEDKMRPAKIRANAFERRKDFKEVHIDEGIIEIGYNAFGYDEGYDDLDYNLTTVKLPETLTSIGMFAFYRRGGLTSINIPNNVTKIDSYAFSNNVSLQEVTLLGYLKSIGSSAFSKCKSLQKIIIPNYVTHIYDSAFDDCENLSEIILPDSITYIGYDAFENTAIETIKLPASLENFSSGMVKNTKIKNLDIPPSVSEIEDSTLGCMKLESITVSDTTEVDPDAFEADFYCKQKEPYLEKIYCRGDISACEYNFEAALSKHTSLNNVEFKSAEELNNKVENEEANTNNSSGEQIVSTEKSCNIEDINQAIENYLMNNPSKIAEILQLAADKEREEAMLRASENYKKNWKEMSEDDENTPFIGPKDAKITIVEFFDFNCGYCKRLAPALLKVINENPDVKVVFKPVAFLAPTSQTAARAFLTAAKYGKHYEFYEALLKHNYQITDSVIDEKIKSIGLDLDATKRLMDSEKIVKNFEEINSLSKKVEIQGVPTLIINGTPLNTNNASEIQNAINNLK